MQKLTLLDFPGKVACTVFTAGCNFRCPFCHNTSLVTGAEATKDDLDTEEFFSFLRSRQGRLDGVCVSGGEPLLQKDIREFILRIREMGFLVKLDTNGSFPDVLESLLKGGLIDYVAMDIKSSPEHYERAVGLPSAPVAQIGRSIQILLTSSVPFEFRTTVVDELHVRDDFSSIGEWISGAPRYYLQEFSDSGDVLSPGCHAMGREQMQEAARTISDFVSNVAIR
jgi:pyruvate formate lyase activating enzyme